MKRIFSALFLLIMVFGARGYAQGQDEDTAGQDAAIEEGAPAEEASPEGAYEFPVIAPTGTLFFGPRIVGFSGSTRADEYEYLHGGVSLGTELRLFSFPSRLHLDMDVKDKKDYYGDLNYAYKDIVLLNVLNRTVFHNLEHIKLAGLPPASFINGTPVAPTDPAIGTQAVYDKDPGASYGVRWSMTSAFLRFKTPDYPFHLYLDGSIIRRDGIIQQRFLWGSGAGPNIVRASQSREIDWETKHVTVGTNTHLGPVEVDISHGEKRFDPGANHVLTDFYTAAGSSGTPPIGPGSTRDSGVYMHNLVPELQGSSNTLKLHSSYTGKIVASATFSKIDRENKDSGAKADYFIGAGEVTWTAAPNLAVFVKYRHREADIDNSLSNPLLCVGPNAGCIIKASVSSITDNVSATVRYRPLSRLTLRADYSYDNIRRENSDEWFLTDRTQRNVASLSADMRLVRNMNIRASYTYKNIDDPAYNIEPNHSNEGKLIFSWTPAPKITAFLSYDLAKEKRDHLLFLTTSGGVEAPLADVQGRSVHRDRAMAAVSYLLSNQVSVTGSYAYIHNRIEQEIDTGSLVDAPDSDLAHTYALNFTYIPNDRIDLTGGVSYTISKGGFTWTDPTQPDVPSIATYSRLSTRETVYSMEGEYHFGKGLTAGIQYSYSDFNDMLDNPWDDVQDGRAHIVLLTLSKKW